MDQNALVGLETGGPSLVPYNTLPPLLLSLSPNIETQGNAFFHLPSLPRLVSCTVEGDSLPRLVSCAVEGDVNTRTGYISNNDQVKV